MTLRFTRRETITTALGAGLALTSTSCASAQPQPEGIPAMSGPVIQPLPFDPTSVPGFSERLLRSHYDNNYSGAVKRIGAIQGELAALDPSTAPGFRMNGLKREELLATNSMILHEIHFASFGASSVSPDAALADQLEHDFGSHEGWRREFAAMGKALGGGSGWVILTWSPRLRRLVNQWAADHSMSLAGGAGLIALDMYEHAYHMDYGAKAGDYVDAFMRVLDWRAANAAFGAAKARQS